ncbi:MAG: NAD(+) kinase [Gammaproteobacteria bacterium]|nr:NAD(+) kinase [Gammaproteobacteria bacterium]
MTRKKPLAARFSTIALMGNPQDRRTLDSMQVLTTHLLAAGRKVQASDSLRARALPKQVRRVPDQKIAQGADLVIAIGGDGSMLYAARRIAGRKTSLLGINRGRLGFLADVGPEHMLAKVDEVLAGKFVSEQRMLLLVDVIHGEDVVATGTALNDVVVKRHATGRMCEYQTFVDGRYVNTHLGDGFIVSTPTGSTAYALSCGGPIVEPSLDALLLIPICPHTLSDRPLVIPATHVAEVRLRAGQSEHADVICDGEPVGQLAPGWSIQVRAAKERIELIHPVGYDYFAILRSKLLWGRDAREHASPPVSRD